MKKISLHDYCQFTNIHHQNEKSSAQEHVVQKLPRALPEPELKNVQYENVESKGCDTGQLSDREQNKARERCEG